MKPNDIENRISDLSDGEVDSVGCAPMLGSLPSRKCPDCGSELTLNKEKKDEGQEWWECEGHDERKFWSDRYLKGFENRLKSRPIIDLATADFVPGYWMCRTCNFRLQKRIIGAHAVGDDTAVHMEPCPNDGDVMFPVTWKEYSAGLELFLEQKMAELMPRHSEGSAAIARERLRQIESEGWTAEHDDLQPQGGLAQAAACYASTAAMQSEKGIKLLPKCFIHKNWPWARDWWKPSNDPIRNLEKAGALCAAEIDRLKRLHAEQSVENRSN